MKLSRKQKRAQIAKDNSELERISKYAMAGIIIYCPIVYFLCLFNANMEIEDRPLLLFLYTTILSAALSFMFIHLLEFLLRDRKLSQERGFRWDILFVSTLFLCIPNYFLIRAGNELLSFEADFKTVVVNSKTLTQGKHQTCDVAAKIDDRLVPLTLKTPFCKTNENQILVRKGILGLYAVRRMQQLPRGQ